MLSTKVRERKRQDLAYLIVRRTRNADAPGLRQCLQPRRNVHAIAEKVTSAHHYVSDVHANAEIDAAVKCETGVRLDQGVLRLHRALHGVHSTAKLGKH